MARGSAAERANWEKEAGKALGLTLGWGSSAARKMACCPKKDSENFHSEQLLNAVGCWQMLEAKPQIWIVMRQCWLICWFNIWTTQLAPQHLWSNIDTDQQFLLNWSRLVTSSVKPGAMMVNMAAGITVANFIGSHLKNSTSFNTTFQAL
jgi:hypothetical protein